LTRHRPVAWGAAQAGNPLVVLVQWRPIVVISAGVFGQTRGLEGLG